MPMSMQKIVIRQRGLDELGIYLPKLPVDHGKVTPKNEQERGVSLFRIPRILCLGFLQATRACQSGYHELRVHF